MRRIVVTLLSLAVAIAFASGCSSSGGKACQNDTECQADQYCGTDGKCYPREQPDGSLDGSDGNGPDGADGTDQGPPPCAHDRECPPDKICQAGACVAGETCSADYHCSVDHCPNGVVDCYCDPTGKVCKRRSLLCEPCVGDYQCPDPGMGDKCIEYPTGKFCGKRCGVAACPVGYVCDTQISQCRSNTGSCAGTFVCHSDGDCAANQVCNPMTGNCVPKCTEDTNCPAGQKCHYTGHCAAPCQSDTDCGQDLICCTGSGVPSPYCTAASVGKCRPMGCVLHSECLVADGTSLGYCDKRTHQCQPGCRAADPRTVNDCRSGMKCDCTGGSVACDVFDCCPDPGEYGQCVCDPTQQSCATVKVCDNGACIKIPCNERGDVSVACARNNVCCGWPADGYACPGTTPVGDCYIADKNQWCAPCGEEGKECTQPSNWGHGEKGVCLKDGKDSNTYCHIGCRDAQDCPSTWACAYSFVQGCDQNSDCESGATCQVVAKQKNSNGEVQELKACVCGNDNQCAQDLNGFAGHCLSATMCDTTQSPPVCNDYMLCHYAKACQCQTCCGELHSGG